MSNRSKKEQKQKMIRIGALIVAGVMTISVLLLALVK